ncbi:hypothetical protein XaC1_24 [Xanthomonas phage XaC1]|nr:hypothetical protein XaC1_24 [Xanthomonas phage XaC1]
MKRYINAKSGSVTETIEELDSKDFASMNDFKNTLATRVGSHRMTLKSFKVYVSSRCDKSWTGN